MLGAVYVKRQRGCLTACSAFSRVCRCWLSWGYLSAVAESCAKRMPDYQPEGRQYSGSTSRGKRASICSAVPPPTPLFSDKTRPATSQFLSKPCRIGMRSVGDADTLGRGGADGDDDQGNTITNGTGGMGEHHLEAGDLAWRSAGSLALAGTPLSPCQPHQALRKKRAGQANGLKPHTSCGPG